MTEPTNNELRKLITEGLKNYRAFADAKVALDAYDALEQRAADLMKTIGARMATLDDLALKQKNTEESAAKTKAEADKYAEMKREDAEKEARAKIAAAEKKAAEIVRVANEEGDDVKKKAADDLATLIAEIAQNQSVAEESRAVAESAVAAAKEAEERLAILNDELSKTKARAAAI